MFWFGSSSSSSFWNYHQIARSSFFPFNFFLVLLAHPQKLLICQVITVIHLLSLPVSSPVLFLVLLLLWLNINKQLLQSRTNSESRHTTSSGNWSASDLLLPYCQSFMESSCTIYDPIRTSLRPSCRISRTPPEINEKLTSSLAVMSFIVSSSGISSPSTSYSSLFVLLSTSSIFFLLSASLLLKL